MSADDGTALIEALQGALAGEHAALYAYEVVGGRLRYGTKAQERATASYRRHRSHRDALVASLRKAGETPVAAEPAYEMPAEVTNVASARKVAVQVEDRCTTLYAELVASASGVERRTALESMTWCAKHQLAWGGSSTALPGVGTA